MSLKVKRILYYIIIPIYIFVVVLVIRSIECKFWNLDIALKIATFLKDIALATCPIITIYINSKIKKDEYKHQKEMKIIEIFDTKKREALKDFIDACTEYLKEDESAECTAQVVKTLYNLQLYFKIADNEFLSNIKIQLLEDSDKDKIKKIFWEIIDTLHKELEFYDNNNLFDKSTNN